MATSREALVTTTSESPSQPTQKDSVRQGSADGANDAVAIQEMDFDVQINYQRQPTSLAVHGFGRVRDDFLDWVRRLAADRRYAG